MSASPYTVLPAAQSSVPAALAALRQAQAVALPTDTLYGLAASARSPAAIKARQLAARRHSPLLTMNRGRQRLYEIKGRSAHSPLAICVAEPEDVCRYAQTEHLPAGLVTELLPGCVTLVLDRLPGVLCDELNPGIVRIGAPWCRCPPGGLSPWPRHPSAKQRLCACFSA